MISIKILRALGRSGYLRDNLKAGIKQLIQNSPKGSPYERNSPATVELAGVAYTYCQITQEPWPEMEPLIAGSPYDYQYASRVLGLKGENCSFWGEYRIWVDKGMLPIHPETHKVYENIRKYLRSPSED